MQETKFTILLLGTQMAVGGAQKVLLDQANWFYKHGHKVTVAFFYDKEFLHEKWQADAKFPIVNLNAYQKDITVLAKVILILQGLFRFWNLLTQYKFQIVETFTHDSNMLALPLTWMAGVPVRIATHHGALDNFPKWRQKIHTFIVNSGIASILVAVSEKMRQKAIEEGIKPKYIRVIQNGVMPLSLDNIDKYQVRQKLNLNTNNILLVTVGRLVYPKAHEILISAMPYILKEFPIVKLGVCGDGILRQNLEQQVVKLNLQEHVIFFGMLTNIAEVLSLADIFVLPSRREGLPIALLEAMSIGLPCVVAKAEGLDEIITHGEDGLLVPVEDVNALAGAISQLLYDPKMRAKIGDASKSKIEAKYSIDHMAEKYLSLIIEIINKSRKNEPFTKKA